MKWGGLPRADVLLLAVAHQEFLDRTSEMKGKLLHPAVLIDVKSAVDLDRLKDDGISVWRL